MKLCKKSVLFLGLWIIFGTGCQTYSELNAVDFRSPRTVNSERNKFRRHLIDSIITVNLESPPDINNAGKWQSALWAMNLSRFTSQHTTKSIDRAMSQFSDRPLSIQRALLETAAGLYPERYKMQVSGIVEKTTNPKIFAMAVHYQMQNAPDKSTDYYQEMERKFPGWQADPVLYSLYNDLPGNKPGRQTMPPVTDLLTHSFPGNPVVFYSFHRSNRDYPGLTIIRQPDGRIMRNPDGTIFRIRHLSRSAAGLPDYITNGNTPQGIYAVSGTARSENVFIGPVPTLQMGMPFELPPNAFFPERQSSDTTWSQDLYKSLLPLSWQNYFPIHGTYYAGKAGRSEIIAHGTTIDPAFYHGQTYYPLTPSLGCLTALDLWDPETGICVRSDQVDLINAYRKLGERPGYFVIIELDDIPAAVEIDEIRQFTED